MRKTVITLSFLMFSFLVLLPVSSSAQNPTQSALREEKRLEQKERLEEKKETLTQKRIEQQERKEERRATREAQLNQRKRERIRHFWGLLSRRLSAASERIQKLIDRIESRVSKIEEADDELDLVDVKLQLEEAKDMLSEVNDNIELVNIQIEDALTAQNPKLLFGEVISLVREIKNDLKEIHNLLVHLIGDIKGLRVGQGSDFEEPEVSITVSITPTVVPTEEVTPTLVPTLEPTL